MKQLATLNPENVSEVEVNSYRIREAVRAIVVDEQNAVALLHVTAEAYYKIPGGGIKHKEDHESALQRECLEEIGSEVEVLAELGFIVEWRKFCNLKQISYCYFAKLKGKKGTPRYTQKELSQGFKQLWVPYNEAVQRISQHQATSIEGSRYIVPRDTLFLETAVEFVNL